jgi:hypothetical protein
MIFHQCELNFQPPALLKNTLPTIPDRASQSKVTKK